MKRTGIDERDSVATRFRCRHWIFLVASGVFMLPGTYAAEPVPKIDGITYSTNVIELAISNINTGGTYNVERTTDLLATHWMEAGSFEGEAASINWVGSISESTTSTFYRVIRDPYHPRVGESASLDMPGIHAVSGSAHIVNNRTIELRDFNFDGGGLDVVVFVSPNSDFYPGISISENLVRPAPYINTNMTFSLPAGYDLNDANYISIWCIDIPVSFSDGMFQ